MTAPPHWFVDALARAPRRTAFQVDGASINCLSWGMEDGAKPGLLFVHGFMAHAQWWSPIAPMFLRTHRVAAIDLSGMGDSDHRGVYSQDRHAREVAGAIRHLGFHETTIVAHSFGGIPSCAALIDDPALAVRLVLVDSPVLLGGVPRKDPRGARPHRPHATREAALARFRLVPPVRAALDYYQSFVADHSLIETEQGWVWKFDWKMAAFYEPSPPVDLSRIALDSWVLHGEESEVQTPERARQLAAAVGRPDQWITLSSCDHHVMIEQPLALVAALRVLLAGAPAPPVWRNHRARLSEAIEGAGR